MPAGAAGRCYRGDVSTASDRPHVLIVDDEPNIRAILAEVFEEAGWTTALARDGIVALDVARLRRPDLMVVDLMMPRMDGETFTRAARSIPDLADVPVIVASAGTHVDLAAVGADAFLAKPFDLDEVLALAESLLRIDVAA